MIQLDGGNYDGILIVVTLIMVGPPVVLTLIGVAVRKKNPTTAKVFYILAALYLLIGLGLCGGIIG